MQFLKLTPLQSRFAACLGTSIIVLVVYFSLNPSHFAYAAELDSITNEDHNHHRIAFSRELDSAHWGDDDDGDESNLVSDVRLEDGPAMYEPEFGAGVSRGIIGRAPLDSITLKNNLPNTLNINAGETQYYMFEKAEVFAEPGNQGSQLPTNVTGDGSLLKRGISLDGEDNAILVKRQNGSRTVYLSMNTCLQPNPEEGKTATPGQLIAWYSLDDNNQKPTSNNNDGTLRLDQGFAAAQIPDVTGNVYIAINAPALPANTFTGPWSYQVAASIDTFYHYYNDSTAFLWTVDTDATSALIATYNLTGTNDSDPTVNVQRQAWMESQPPFGIFIFNSSSPLINGIEKSYCGLSKLNMEYMQISSIITERGIGANPKQQFHVQSLQPGQTYFSVLAYGGGNASGNAATIAGGGQVWRSSLFTTKSDDNCRLIFDLPFCTAVAYAVPTNPENKTLADRTTLSKIYDSYAEALYKNFTNSLQQIPCNTTSSAQYSLASNCTDCARDYKVWLCAVTIPRCVDFTTPNTPAYNFLAPRNIGQNYTNGSVPDLTPQFGNASASMAQQLVFSASRNPLIDTEIKPGPYKELLPCQELCYNLVRSCPTSLGFRCPRPGSLYGDLSKSYWEFDSSRIVGKDGVLNISQLSCNFLGVDWPALGSGAAGLRVGDGLLAVSLAVTLWFLR